jgi:hypothetical protein
VKNGVKLQKNFLGVFLFFQHFILHNFLSRITTDGLDPGVKAVLLKLCSLYGACSLERHLATLYQGMYHLLFELPPVLNLAQNQLSLFQVQKWQFSE